MMNKLLYTILYAFLYFLSAQFSHYISGFSSEIASVWLPFSIGFVLLWFKGFKYFPAILLGDIANSLFHLDIAPAVLVSGFNTFAIVCSVYILSKKIHRDRLFETSSNYIFFVIFGSAVPSFLSATFGSGVMIAWGYLSSENFITVWTGWFFSDFAGLLLLTPVLYSHLIKQISPASDYKNLRFYLIIFVIVVFSVVMIYCAKSQHPLQYTVPFFVLPFLGWSAFRLQLRGFSVIMLAAASASIITSIISYGSHFQVSGFLSITLLQIYLCVHSITFYLLKSGRIDIMIRELDTLDIIGKAAEYNDNETGKHVRRVAEFSKLIAVTIGVSQKFQEKIFYSSPLHDVGKIGIADSILLKPGKLDEEEFEIMKSHTLIGKNLLINKSSEYLLQGAEIAESHHEKWDGSGYPLGLKGEQIPLSGRIVAVADVFDALTSKRPYKEPWSIEDALDYIKKNRGTHFDPKIVEAFIENEDSIRLIMKRFKD